MQEVRRRFARARTLTRDQSGAALIEFALSVPLLLLIGLGGLEVASFGIASLRVSQMSMTIADNAARERDQISESDINDFMTGAKFIGRNIQFADHGRIILSNLEATTDGKKQWIRWQRCDGALGVTSSYGVPRDKNGAEVTDLSSATAALTDYGAVETKTNLAAAGMGTSTNQVAALPGTAVMFVEIVYEYQPIVSNQWIGPQTLRYTSAFNVRQRTDQVLKRGTTTYAEMSRCNQFKA